MSRVLFLDDLYRPVVVAVVTVGMVQVAVHQVVHVISVGDLLVAAVRAVLMRGLMPAALVIGSACRWIAPAHFQNVLVYVVSVRMVQVPVVEVVDVPLVFDGGMTAVLSVLVFVTFMLVT